MEFTDDEVVIDKPANDLDRLVLDVAGILEALDVRYAIVSGYVAVLFGRARATEDIDVITERFDEATANRRASELRDGGYWGSAMPLDEMYATLADDRPVRVAEKDHRVPNVELKFGSDQYDRASLENTIAVNLPDGTLLIGSIELQIAYKLDMGAQKDFEDAIYLYEVAEEALNNRELERFVSQLGVGAEYERLKATR